MSIYEMVTDRIIQKLQEGTVPWKKCWKSHASYAYNRVSKRPYSFLNQMLLSKNGEYASFKQWKELGGHVKQGEKGEIVVFWKFFEKKIEKDEKDEEGDQKTSKMIPMLRYYTVFHISQVEGVEPLPDDSMELEEDTIFEPIDDAEILKMEYLSREGIELEESEYTEAFYCPGTDKIEVPAGERFGKPEEYYATLFHEMVHSTGHPNRLNRDLSGRFGSKRYAAEELVAELGSSFLLASTGIGTEELSDNSASYIQSWISHLRNDPKMIVIASGKAEKAIKFIENVA